MKSSFYPPSAWGCPLVLDEPWASCSWAGSCRAAAAGTAGEDHRWSRSQKGSGSQVAPQKHSTKRTFGKSKTPNQVDPYKREETALETEKMKTLSSLQNISKQQPKAWRYGNLKGFSLSRFYEQSLGSKKHWEASLDESKTIFHDAVIFPRHEWPLNIHENTQICGILQPQLQTNEWKNEDIYSKPLDGAVENKVMTYSAP